MDEPTQRQLSAAALSAAAARRAAVLTVRESDLYRQSLARLGVASSALGYLDAVKAALSTGLRLPQEFNDHELQRPPLKGCRSVVIGESSDSGSDLVFILIYRRKRAVLDLLYVAAHDEAYRGAAGR